MYTWNNPVTVKFGPGTVKGLRFEKMPGTKALLLTSAGTSAKKNGSLDAVTAALTDQKIPYVLFDQVESNPIETTLMKGVELGRAESCDFVIGIGGGSVLDAATVIAAMIPLEEGRIWDYIRGGTGGKMRRAKAGLPYIAVTTSAGTGSEVDCYGVVTNAETQEKISFTGDHAVLAVIDPELMLTVPPAFTAYQGFDAFLHCVEGYLARGANEMSDMMALEGVRTISAYLPKAVADGSDIDARTKMAWGNVLGGYSMEISTNISEHSLEHAMSAHHPALPHGAGLILICEAYFELLLSKGGFDERFVTLAKACGKENASKPDDFLAALRELKEACGVADLKMRDYDIEPGEFEKLVEDARATMGSLFRCDWVRLSDEELTEVFEKSYK